MNEIIQLAGVKDVYGDDVVQAQKEPLDALHALLSNFGAFIVSGCVVTPNVGTPANFDVSAGIVAISHAAGFKVARFAGGSNYTSVPKLYINEAVVTGNYGTGTNTIGYNYTALATTGAVPGGAPYLQLVDPLNAIPPTLEAAINKKYIVTSATLTHNDTNYNTSLIIRVNKLTRTATIEGTATYTGSLAGTTALPSLNLFTLMPLATIQADPTIGKIFTAGSTKYIPAYVKFTGTAQAWPENHVTCWLWPTGTQQGIYALAGYDPAGALYTFDISGTIYLD